MREIKEFLIKNNFDYFLLPNNDEFFSEYLPENHKRIEFISGFNGSNATIIFSQKRHYFFTDGRYLLQAKQQLDLTEFDIIDSADYSPLKWLQKNLDNNCNLAIDPNLLSKKFVDECTKFLSKITFLQKNPIDDIWLKRPNIARQKAFSCPVKLAGEDLAQKKQRLIERLNCDALFISKPENLNWLLNIRGSDIEFTPIFLAQALFFKNGALTIFSDENLLANIDLPNVTIVSHQQFEKYCENLASQKVIIQTDFATTNYSICEIFAKNNLTYFHQQCPLDLLKAVKNETEIFGARKAHQHDAIAMINFIHWLDDKQKNNQVNDKKICEISAQEKLLALRQQSDHFFYPSFATISGYQANGAVIHYHASPTSNKEFIGDSLYLVDSGGQYFGNDFCGTTDITRTLAIGKPSRVMIENYTRIIKGHIALARVKFPRGTSGANLDALARFHLWNANKDYAHGTGHGVGSFLSVHEGPCAISKNSHTPLQAGMILSNEPGYYEEGEYGIRLENLMLVKEFDDKFLYFETLTLVPFELDLIDLPMLTYPEKKWLFDYHINILRFIEDKFDEDKISWFVAKYLDFK